MNLKDLLVGKGIEPRRVLVLRHRPLEPELNKVLPRLAAEKPEVFNAYQQTQTKQVEREMAGAEYVAAFIGRGNRSSNLSARLRPCRVSMMPSWLR
jgi:hypothetical protein